MITKRLVIITLFLIIMFTVGCQTKLKESTKEQTIKENNVVINEEKSPKEEIVYEQLPTQHLRKGNNGEAVANLQYFLIKLGYPLEITSFYDEETTWAITDFQLSENIMATGFYDSTTKEALQNYLDNGKSVSFNENLQKPTYSDNTIVENPYDVLALVNKERSLPHNYEPNDLTIPDVRFPFAEDHPKKQLRKIAANALEELFAAGDESGVHLFAQSGYRSYDRQESIFASNVSKHGEEYANRYSARPGESEHQTGLVMDVTSESVHFQLIEEFGETKEGKWLQEHAHEFGFIIRYPKGKEEITGYMYEPWHIRYLGVDVATALYESGLTYEEFLIEEGIISKKDL